MNRWTLLCLIVGIAACGDDNKKTCNSGSRLVNGKCVARPAGASGPGDGTLEPMPPFVAEQAGISTGNTGRIRIFISSFAGINACLMVDDSSASPGFAGEGLYAHFLVPYGATIVGCPTGTYSMGSSCAAHVEQGTEVPADCIAYRSWSESGELDYNQAAQQGTLTLTEESASQCRYDLHVVLPDGEQYSLDFELDPGAAHGNYCYVPE